MQIIFIYLFIRLIEQNTNMYIYIKQIIYIYIVISITFESILNLHRVILLIVLMNYDLLRNV